MRRFDELDSTNRYLIDEARAGAREGVVAVADRQTAGRGRLDRSWEAPPGSALLVSVFGRHPSQVKARLQQSADAVAGNGTSPFYGKGRLNVSRALGVLP